MSNSCSSSDSGDDGGSLSVDGVSLVGTWALTGDDQDYDESWETPISRDFVDCICTINDKGIITEYENDYGAKYSNGQINVPFSDFGEVASIKAYVEGNNLIYMDILHPVTVVNKNQILLTTVDITERWERVTSFAEE